MQRHTDVLRVNHTQGTSHGVFQLTLAFWVPAECMNCKITNKFSCPLIARMPVARRAPHQPGCAVSSLESCLFSGNFNSKKQKAKDTHLV